MSKLGNLSSFRNCYSSWRNSIACGNKYSLCIHFIYRQCFIDLILCTVFWQWWNGLHGRQSQVFQTELLRLRSIHAECSCSETTGSVLLPNCARHACTTRLLRRYRRRDSVLKLNGMSRVVDDGKYHIRLLMDAWTGCISRNHKMMQKGATRNSIRYTEFIRSLPIFQLTVILHGTIIFNF